MQKIKFISPIFCIRVVTLMLVSSLIPAYAYVDPGSGSVIVTTILGILAAIGYTFRKYFYKLRRLITGKRTTVEEENNSES